MVCPLQLLMMNPPDAALLVLDLSELILTNRAASLCQQTMKLIILYCSYGSKTGKLVLCISAGPLLKTPTIAHFTPLRRQSLSSNSTTMSSSTTTIEHIALFNVKDSTNATQLSAMLTGLNSLRSLDTVHHLSAGPVHRTRSTSLKFTHILHSRYRSKEHLAGYSAHPTHMDVVRSTILPICDDIMAVDWVAHNIDGSEGPKPGSAMRVQLVKLKEGLGEREKAEVLEVIGGLNGENFSPARAKGFSIGSIRVFPVVSELDAVDQNVEIAKEKDKVRDYIDELLIVDYVLPSPQSASL